MTIQDLYELSPMQQGMLFHTLYAPETGIYFEQRHCLLEGALVPDIFKQAWQKVCDRYDVLRSEFHWEDTDKPLQAVYQTVELPWAEGDWRKLSVSQQTEKFESFLIAEQLKGFQLDRAPLMRCALFQLTNSQYRFVWSYHHLLMDGWCNSLLIREVLTIYQTIRQSKPPLLPPVKPYRDYIVWLQQQDGSLAEAYWRDVLKGFEAPTPLGIEQRIEQKIETVEAKQSSVTSEQNGFLPLAFSKDLQTFAKQSRLTLNTLLQGAWAIVLSRYSGLQDVLFGITVSGRPPELSGVASMVGLFINTVPLRVEVSGAFEVLPWLQTLQQTQRDREAYSYSTLTDVQACSDVPGGVPLFESLLVFENYPVSIEQATQQLDIGLSLRDGQGYEQTNYPLVLVVIPGEEIQLSLRYDSHRISKSAVNRLIGHIEVVLRSFADSPEQSLTQVPLLTQLEQRKLDEISEGKSVVVSSVCVHQRFEERAFETPEAIAIIFSSKSFENAAKSTSLSYRQLNERVNKIAHYLLSQGVRRGTRVGFCLARSVDVVASLLAILKAGGTYVPLDPNHPKKRLNYIIKDAQIDLLVSTSNVVEQLLVTSSISVLCLDSEADSIEAQPTENLSPIVNAEDIAYILYTSGSTGKPKGVPIRHSSLTNFLASMAQLFDVTASDTLLAVTTLGFDIAALEIFLPLVTGAQLVMTPYAITLDGEQLIDQLTAHNITLMQATPATWRLLLNAGWQGSADLKILCGGEALDLSLAQQLLACGRELWNLYGPTETTIWSGALKIDRERLAADSVPIGSPIANTQFYVLDEQYRQMPVGGTGELCIGGAGLSLGYWNRENLTVERFVDVNGQRLYKTGDRVRYREDGTLDYLGRLDNQVKLRGFRIELGAIETLLTQHPDIEQAVVIVSGEENPQLLAYVKLAIEGKEILDKALRQYLSQQLPAYMVPTGYQVLEAFPLTPNGKVDRQALPAIASPSTATQPPEGPTEKLVAGIWADVLGTDNVNLNDNFFELGGHSLLATQVIAQVRQVFEAEVPLRSLFESPTLADFVSSLQQARSQSSAPIFPPITRTDKLVLSYAQQRQWLMTRLDPDSPAYNIPTAIRLKGELSVEGLGKSIAQVVSRHDTLRTIYPAVNGTAVPVILTDRENTAASFEVVDLSCLDEKTQHSEVKKAIRQQVQQPFDLAQGPLWRSQLLKLSDREHILLFTLHHIVADGWSIDVLRKELTAFYQASLAGKKPDVILPPLPIRYGDYAAWQRSLDLTQQLTYWQQQLRGIAPCLDLPTDYARPAEFTSAGASYEFRLSQPETAALQQFSQRNKATLFMTLLAAFKALIYRYSGLCDLAIGLPIANRQQHELVGLIGLFVNTLVIRTQIKNNHRFSDFLTHVRSVTLEAYSHQDLPFEQLIDALEIPRSRSHTPLVQVMFALQNEAPEGSEIHELGGSNSKLEWMPLSVKSEAVKFDLTLDIKETSSGLIGRWEYRSDLFSADTIHQMVGHLRTLLKALPNSGDVRISELPMLSHSEVEQIKGWQQGHSDQSLTTEPIHQLFEAQAAVAPASLALVHHQTQLTYQTLNQQANQLACYLRESGVDLETPVGVWAIRSSEIIIAILAILKAGGTYIPLDPHYPIERLTWMVKDTNMALLLAHRSNVGIPTEIEELVPTISLNSVTEQIEQQPAVNLSLSVNAHSLAYIIYTSGSTGQPKGVCVTHQGVTRLVKSPNYVTLTAHDSLLQAAPLTFDASTFEIWGALLNGGKLVLLPVESPSLEELGNTISTHQITTLWLTSGLFNLMVDEQLHSLSTVRQLIAGGDVLSVGHLRKALKTLKNTRIINGYGPTEGTTFTCCHTVVEHDLNSAVPVGYPVQHTRVYVLDADLQEVPAGVPGELYIGGAGVARGYLNQPALTAERFVPNPFYSIRQPSNGHFYLYKTGDRVRYRNDGALEYLGRLDQQVKVRGFRIELGEIEAALESYPKVQQSVVIVSGDGAQQKRIVAYIETTADIKSLTFRQFLLEKLPDYMVPAKFVLLEAMPLTANGKVDRTSLPAPQWAVENELEENMPQGAVEETLIAIFSALLPAESVGVHDNFFELGGDSILAMQIVSRASQVGLKISPKQLFQYQTVAELAAIAQKEDHTPIFQQPTTGKVSLTPIQKWFFEQNLAVPEHFNQSVQLALPVAFDRAALEQAIAHIYDHHDALRLRFSQTESGWQQSYSGVLTPPDISWFDVSQVSATEQKDAIAQKIQALQASLNIQNGPLLNIGVFNFGNAQPSQLFITIHHLVIDGVSWRMLLTDLQQAYQQAVIGEAIQLAPRSHSYQQWAQELEQLASSPAIEADFEHWQSVLSQSKALNTLPQIRQTHQHKTDKENTVGSSQTVATAALSADLTQALLQSVPPIYNTQITEVLLTAFTQTITQWTKEPTTLINLESYGRFSDTLNLSHTLGWFTAIYPAALRFDQAQPVGNNLKAIKAQLRSIPSQGISYGLLRYTNPQYASQIKALAVTPSISFNYLGQLDTLEKGGFRKVATPTSMSNNRTDGSSSQTVQSDNQAAANCRHHLLDINSWIENSQLQMQWTFSRHYHTLDTIEQLSEQFISNLSALIKHCCERESVEYAPDDFGLAQLDQSALEAVMSQVSFTTAEPTEEVTR